MHKKEYFRPFIFFIISVLFFLNCTNFNINNNSKSSALSYDVNGYYVAKDGSDDFPGTWEKPWLTIQKAANTLTAGRTVYIKAGTYKEHITINVQGNATNGYITFKNYNNDIVIIDGTGINLSDWTGLLQSYDKSYIRIQGFHIQNAYASGLKGASILINGDTVATHIEIINNEISNHDGGNGIIGKGINLSNILIDSNNVHNCNTHSLEAIRINSGVTYFKVINNTVHDNSNIGIDCVGWGVQPAYGLIKGNTCYRNGLVAGGAHGIYLDGGTYIIIEDNICYDNPQGGISVAAEYGGEIAHNNIVRRNIIYGGGVKGFTLGGSTTSNGKSQDCAIIHNVIYNNNNISGWPMQIKINYCQGTNIVKNNIIYDVTADANREIIQHAKIDNSGDIISDYNCFYTNNAYFTYMASSGHLLADWKTASGKDNNSIDLNPNFIDGINHNFHLQSSSPCINTGDFLTRTTSAGSGTLIQVSDARSFCDGYGLFDGDIIKVGTNNPVRIINVNYTTNVITVDTAIFWSNNDGVSYSYNGSRPDMGVYEY